MTVRRSILCLVVAFFVLSAGSAMGIYVSNCGQVCTPTCPCSITCQGPFGPTTCGQAGEACTGLAGGLEEEEEVLFAPSFMTVDTNATAQATPVEVVQDNNEQAESQETAEQPAKK